MQKFLSTGVAFLVIVSAANAQVRLTSSSPVNAWSPRAPGSGLDGGSYQYDDGTSENTLGLTGCATPAAVLLWLHRFDAQPGAEVISQVSTTYGSAMFPLFAPPVGTPSGIALYADPSQDGNPSDAVLLTMVTSTVQNPGTDIFNSVPITPTLVSGIFFVAAWSETICATQATSLFPAAMDISQASQGRAWVAAQNGTQPFDPTNLGGMTVAPLELGAIGLPYVFLLRAEGESAAVTTYCTAKLNSLGCLPAIGAVGIPSASATSGFEVRAQNVRNQSAGVLLYGNTGQLSQPFSGGTLCLRTPFRRAPAANAGGTPLPAADCSGSFSVDLSSFAHGSLGGTPAPFLLIPGSVVNCQWWGRDTGFAAPNNTTLTDALEFTIQ